MAEAEKVIPSIWTTGWTDVINTGTWRTAMPVHQKRPAPCHQACAVEGEIPSWVSLAREQRFYEAWLTLVANNPFPAVCGRVCHHPCEGSCNRGQYDNSVAINALEQFIGDLAIKEKWALPAPQKTGTKKVAVIGGGPSGLACAYQLRLLGYQVTILESRPELGGMLRYGIPAYRLPKDILDSEIARILALGVEVQTGCHQEAADLEELTGKYDAVFLAMGAQKARRLGQFEAGPKVLDALGFLSQVNQGHFPELGKQVAVIGGGSVAMDAARSARRLGSQVKVLALEKGSTLPAQGDEIKEALEEGVALLEGTMVLNSGVKGERLELQCTKVALDQAVYPKEIRPIVIPGTKFRISTDTVILAVGQTADLEGWDSLLDVTGGLIEVQADSSTSRPGIFAGGDGASAERNVSSAIGQGKKAALSISRFLGAEHEEGAKENQVVDFSEINTFYFPISPKQQQHPLAVNERLKGFAEAKTGLSADEVQAQSERCFSCGNCRQCDNCLYFCPDMAVVKDSSLEQGYQILTQYCKGCGCCVEECPRGAIVLEEEAR